MLIIILFRCSSHSLESVHEKTNLLCNACLESGSRTTEYYCTYSRNSIFPPTQWPWHAFPKTSSYATEKHTVAWSLRTRRCFIKVETAFEKVSICKRNTPLDTIEAIASYSSFFQSTRKRVQASKIYKRVIVRGGTTHLAPLTT